MIKNLSLGNLHSVEIMDKIIEVPLDESNLYDYLKIYKGEASPAYTILDSEGNINLVELRLEEKYNLNKVIEFSKSDDILEFKLKAIEIKSKIEKIKHFNTVVGTYLNSLPGNEISNILDLFSSQDINSSNIIICNMNQLKEITALKDASGNYYATKKNGTYHIFEIPVLVVPGTENITMIEATNLVAREVGTTIELVNDASLIRAGKIGYSLLYDYGISLIDETRITKVKSA